MPLDPKENGFTLLVYGIFVCVLTLVFIFRTRFPLVALADLDLTSLLPQPSQGADYKHIVVSAKKALSQSFVLEAVMILLSLIIFPVLPLNFEI